MKKLRLALDWTPNTNHTGFFVSQEKGFYRDAGIELDIQSPLDDNYSTTPAKKLELGDTDLAIAPTESLISYHTKATPFAMQAIAALLQEDASAIATLKSSGISRPKELDEKSYASYGARYEDQIVKQMIQNDGGKGVLECHYPDKLGIWNTLVEGTYDATWIFTAWEGVEAENRGIELNTFKLGDYGIPYGYSPVVCAAENMIESDGDLLKSFLKATKRGFEFALSSPEQAVEILKPHLTEHDQEHLDLLKSQQSINSYYLKDGTWGVMEGEVFDTFIDWLKVQNLVPNSLSADILYTNECLG
jgi:ABC-type nitrate/sulfonate/bicarbonate transport system substrate-binding protein